MRNRTSCTTTPIASQLKEHPPGAREGSPADSPNAESEIAHLLGAGSLGVTPVMHPKAKFKPPPPSKHFLTSQSQAALPKPTVDATLHSHLKNAAYHYLSPAQGLHAMPEFSKERLQLGPQTNLPRRQDPQKRRNEEKSMPSRNPDPQNEPAGAVRSTSLSELAPLKYKPYTLRDYAEIRPLRYYTLGGLGANVGGKEWEVKMRQRERMHEFAKVISLANRQTLLNSTTRTVIPGEQKYPEREQAVYMKLRMLEYARRVPKPKLARIPEMEEVAFENKKAKTEPLSELEKLEIEHNELVERAMQLRPPQSQLPPLLQQQQP